MSCECALTMCIHMWSYIGEASVCMRRMNVWSGSMCARKIKMACNLFDVPDQYLVGALIYVSVWVRSAVCFRLLKKKHTHFSCAVVILLSFVSCALSASDRHRSLSASTSNGSLLFFVGAIKALCVLVTRKHHTFQLLHAPLQYDERTYGRDLQHGLFEFIE